MGHDVVDEGGNKYYKGWDQQYHQEQGIFGPKQATNILGSPKIDHDLIGDRKAERDMLGAQRTSAAGQPLYQSGGGGGGFDNPLVGLGLIAVVLGAIVTCGLFLIPWWIGSKLAKRMGRPWGAGSRGTIIASVAIGVLIVWAMPLAYQTKGMYLSQDAYNNAHNMVNVGWPFFAFAGLLLMLKLAEVHRFNEKGYDDSPLSIRYLWSWIITLVPFAVGVFCLVGVYAANTGQWNTQQSLAEGYAIAAAVSFVITLGGWWLGRRTRQAIAADRNAVVGAQYARYA